MVSKADNPNFMFLEPFIKWAQEVYHTGVGLRINKRQTNVGHTGSFVTLTNIGKKKTDDPVTVFLKIKKIGLQLASVEICDAIMKKSIYFEADNVKFDFHHRQIDKDLIKNVDNYQESPFDHDEVPEEIAQSGSSRPSSPMVRISGSSPAPPSADSPSTENSIRSAPTASSSTSVNSAQKEITSVEEESENDLLKRELEISTCENLILNIEKEVLMRKLAQPNPPDQFNIVNYKVKRPITVTTTGQRLYLVEQVYTRTSHILKEVLLDRFSPVDHKFGFKTELDLLTELSQHNERSPHLLYFQERHQDLTPIRQSHYILYEPVVMGLEEFSFNFIKKNKNSVPIIIYQLLKAVSFLNKKLFKIHGNIDLHSVVIDTNWNVKLTNFQYSLPISQQVDPRRVLTGKLDYLTKHPSIFEQLERQEPLIINQSIDRWALGCLFYKLLYEGDLFLNSTNYRSHPSLISTMTTLPHGRILFAFFDDYNRIITADNMVNSDFFKKYDGISLRTLFDPQERPLELNQLIHTTSTTTATATTAT